MRRRAGTRYATMLALPLCLAYASVGTVMVGKVVLAWHTLYSEPVGAGTVVDRFERDTHHWVRVQWKEFDTIKTSMEQVSSTDYTACTPGAAVEVVPSTPPLFVYPGHSRAGHLWPLATMAVFWSVAGGIVVKQVAGRTLRSRWLARYGQAVMGTVITNEVKGGVCTLTYEFAPHRGDRPVTGRMLAPVATADKLTQGVQVNILYARNPKSNLVYEASDFEVV